MTTEPSSGPTARELDPSGEGRAFRPAETEPAPWDALRKHRRPWLMIGLVATLAASLLLAVCLGTERLSMSVIVAATGSRLGWTAPVEQDAAWQAMVLFDYRLPRAALMALCGAALSIAGAAYQGLFRNPLADPYIVGVASGAGLGATLTLSIFSTQTVLGLFTVPIGAFLGGLASVVLVVVLSRVGRSTPVTTMLLAGVAVGAFASALTTLCMMRSEDSFRRTIYWLLGGYTSGGWAAVAVVLGYVLVGSLALQRCAQPLNTLQLGEEEARQLGVRVERVRIVVVASATLTTAAAVSFGGTIGFVGLIVPHILRLLIGPDHRSLFLASALGGGVFLVLADLAARMLTTSSDLPLNVLTALLGAPFFIYLLRRHRRSLL